jgi:hypothetical protein
MPTNLYAAYVYLSGDYPTDTSSLSSRAGERHGVQGLSLLDLLIVLALLALLVYLVRLDWPPPPAAPAAAAHGSTLAPYDGG